MYECIAADPDERHLIDKALGRMLKDQENENKGASSSKVDHVPEPQEPSHLSGHDRDDELRDPVRNDGIPVAYSPTSQTSEVKSRASGHTEVITPEECGGDRPTWADAGDEEIAEEENADIVDGIPRAMEEDDDPEDINVPLEPTEASAADDATPVEPIASGVVRSSDEAEGAPEAKKQRIEALSAVMGTSKARRILADIEAELESQAKAKNGNHRQRRSLKQQETKIFGSRVPVAEIYSPPRVARMAERMGMASGWSLDLTEVDPDDGQPWNFSKPDKRAKAKKKLLEDKPALLVACPMCKEFSTWNDLNSEYRTDEVVRDKITEAVSHLQFALELCREQLKAGRLLLFEHPCGASSWETNMVQRLAMETSVESLRLLPTRHEVGGT
jgi:hypothetical protein